MHKKHGKAIQREGERFICHSHCVIAPPSFLRIENLIPRGKNKLFLDFSPDIQDDSSLTVVLPIKIIILEHYN